MKRPYALTFATELTVAASGLLVMWISASYWKPDVFGEYILGRRTLGLLQNAMSLGLLVSIPRYIAQSSAAPNNTYNSGTFFLAGVLLAFSSLALLGLVLLSAPGPVASALFGSERYRPLLGPLYVWLVGVMLHGLAYGYFRGRLRMTAANLLQVVNTGVLGLVPFALAGLSPSAVYMTTGVAMISIAGATLVAIALGELVRPVRWSDLVTHAKELLQYGAPRVPAEFALAALFTLPATLAAHLGGIEQAGHVGFAISGLSLAGSFVAPVGLVLLPDAAARVARGELHHLARGLGRLVLAAAAATSLGVIVLELAADPLVRWYLGPEYGGAAAIVRLVMLGAVPYVCYVLLRSVIDAATVRALNTRTLVIALAVFAAVVALFPSVPGVAIALSSGCLVAGVLSARDAWSLLRRTQGASR